jgi:hypothetical protein
MKLTPDEVQKFQRLENLLNSALVKLDERGTDETVSKAMSIVYTGFESVLNGKELSPNQLYREAIATVNI